jgi:hypothetical protein
MKIIKKNFWTSGFETRGTVQLDIYNSKYDGIFFGTDPDFARLVRGHMFGNVFGKLAWFSVVEDMSKSCVHAADDDELANRMFGLSALHDPETGMLQFDFSFHGGRKIGYPFAKAIGYDDVGEMNARFTDEKDPVPVSDIRKMLLFGIGKASSRYGLDANLVRELTEALKDPGDSDPGKFGRPWGPAQIEMLRAVETEIEDAKRAAFDDFQPKLDAFREEARRKVEDLQHFYDDKEADMMRSFEKDLREKLAELEKARREVAA